MCGTSLPDIYDVPNKWWFEWTNSKEFVNPPETVLDKRSVIETSSCGASPKTQVQLLVPRLPGQPQPVSHCGLLSLLCNFSNQTGRRKKKPNDMKAPDFIFTGPVEVFKWQQAASVQRPAFNASEKTKLQCAGLSCAVCFVFLNKRETLAPGWFSITKID